MEPKPVCESCQRPAIVQIRNAFAGEVLIRYLCLDCADAEDDDAPAQKRRLNVAAITITMGLYVLGVSMFADVLGFGSADGFGRQQWTGIAITGVLVLVAAIIQIPMLLVAGLLLGGTTLLADWLGLGDVPGFGSLQMLGAALGVGLTILGLGVGRQKKREQEAR